MLAPGHLVRCPCFWPRCPEHFTSDNGYLVPGPADVLRVLYVGARGAEDAGWLYCMALPRLGPCGEDFTLRNPRLGWIPTWAVLRLRAPGPYSRLAWDGRRYPLSAWLDYYGEERGLLYWERAPP